MVPRRCTAADAIAGVVNFITKHDTVEGEVNVGYSAPPVGREGNAHRVQ